MKLKQQHGINEQKTSIGTIKERKEIVGCTQERGEDGEGARGDQGDEFENGQDDVHTKAHPHHDLPLLFD